ncbi:Tim44 domain-containing protein [Phaeovibrio sulfidiphilus]|uniref:Tim44 domain-containing protein n=1 Tax=Phaeovibrio sulfidiphilus TaxID=1220600 RepID=A0A8J6YYF9_9PROT|nr:Tim44/TimA family putative adaptor protein [Phaeovibrio sulfidiphilus]MBE1236848.1 Tim44 domain-containing protein [Phaeovibrio sulfidiphilus]
MENSSFVPILLVALIAVFLVLRLRALLGQHPEDEDDGFPMRREDTGRSPYGTDANGHRDGPDSETGATGFGADGPVLDPTLAGTLTRIRLADPSFSAEDFLNGARSAFQMVLLAFAKGDRRTLETLLSPEVMRNFENVIREREEAGETMESELISFKSVAIETARLDGSIAHMTIKYVTEQVNLLKNADGEVIEGDPNRIETLTDIWTFERDITSGNPNWLLVATRSSDV